MKMLTLAVLTTLLLSSLQAHARPKDLTFDVLAAGGTTLLRAGDTATLIVKADAVDVIVKSCLAKCPPNTKHLPVVSLTSNNVAELVAGQRSPFLRITWISSSHEDSLVVLTSGKKYTQLLQAMETVTQKKAIDADSESYDRPRLILRSSSAGNTVPALRNQAVEMAGDLDEFCPTMLVTINADQAHYTIELNHLEFGLVGRDNQFQLFNQNGDLMNVDEGGSLLDGVRNACDLITRDWAKQKSDTIRRP